jgi:hypothetical protein
MADRIYNSGVRAITDAVTNSDISSESYPANPDAVSSLDLRRWFLNLFPYRNSSVIRRGEGSRWHDVSRFYYLTDEDIIECITPASKSQRGFRFEEKTMFLVLSIPAHSPYHNLDSVLEIRELLQNQLGVSARHYQQDDDWFLYLFLTKEVEAPMAGKQLLEWCISQGFDIASGALEVHPSDKPLPFPLQNRFSWFNDKGQLLVRRTELSTEDAIAFFLQDAGQNSVEPEALFEKMRLQAFGFAHSMKEEPDLVPAQEPSVQAVAVLETETQDLLNFDPAEQAEASEEALEPDSDSASVELEEKSSQIQNVVQLPTVQREPAAAPENFAVQEAQLLLFPGMTPGSFDDGRS